MKKTTFNNKHPARRKLNWLDPSQLAPEGELLTLWPTQIYLFQNDFKNCEWHQAVKRAIEKRAEEKDPTLNANWNESDLLTWPEPECQMFGEFLQYHFVRRIQEEHPEETVRRLRWNTHAWANYKRGLDWHWYHVHSGATFSFVYYLSTLPSAHEDPFKKDFNGDYYGATLEFMDPRGSSPYMTVSPLNRTMDHAKFLIPPSEGLFLIFPSFLWHMVSPMNSKDARISIAGNFFQFKLSNER